MKRTSVRVILLIQATIHSNEMRDIMQKFMRKFEQLNGVEAKVVLEHCLFDKQRFYCRQLQTINDDTRIGVVLKGQEKFVYKHDIKIADISCDTYTISDGKLTIIVNKL